MTSLTTTSHSPLQHMYIMYYITSLFCILIFSKTIKIYHKKSTVKAVYIGTKQKNSAILSHCHLYKHYCITMKPICGYDGDQEF